MIIAELLSKTKERRGKEGKEGKKENFGRKAKLRCEGCPQVCEVDRDYRSGVFLV
jgi:hypothetical protein